MGWVFAAGVAAGVVLSIVVIGLVCMHVGRTLAVSTVSGK